MRSAQSIVSQFAAFVANKTKSVIIEEIKLLAKEVGFSLPTIGHLSMTDLEILRNGVLAELRKLRCAEKDLADSKAYQKRRNTTEKKYVPPQRRLPKLSPIPQGTTMSSSPETLTLVGHQIVSGSKSAGRRTAKFHAEHKAIYNRKIDLPVQELNIGDNTFITLKGLDLNNIPVYGAKTETPPDVQREEFTLYEKQGALMKFSNLDLYSKRMASAKSF